LINREPLEEIAPSGEFGLLAVNLFSDTVIEFQVFYEKRLSRGFWTTKTGALPSVHIAGPPLWPQVAKPPLWDEGSSRYQLSIEAHGSDVYGCLSIETHRGKTRSVRYRASRLGGGGPLV